MRQFRLRATVSSERPELVRPVLESQIPGGNVSRTGDPKELRVEGMVDGPSARELNRTLLSALRRAEKRTRLRAEWTAEGTTERFFDYVPKGKRPATSEPP